MERKSTSAKRALGVLLLLLGSFSLHAQDNGYENFNWSKENIIYTFDTDNSGGTNGIFQWRYGSGGTPLMTITRQAFLGVGSGFPQAPLHFSTGDRNKTISLGQISGVNNEHQFFGFGINGSGNSQTLRYQLGSADLNAKHAFYAAQSASLSNELMRISGEGNVGIGTDNIDFSTRFHAFHPDPTLKNGIVGWFERQGAGDVGISLTQKNSKSYGIVNLAAGGLGFFNNRWPGGAGRLDMKISDDGKVGIGTANPVGQLHVVSVGNLAPSGIFSSTGNDAQIRLIGLGTPTNEWSVGGGLYSNTDNFYIFKEKGSIGPKLVIKDAGNVGIGVDDPDSKLHVKGSVKITSLNGLKTAIYVNDTAAVGIGVRPDRLEKNFALSVNGPTYIGDFNDPGYKTGLVRNNLISDYKLWVEKGVVSEDFAIAEVAEWDDYVFDENYDLPKLQSVENFITTNKHLPNIPSESEVKRDGYSVHKLNRALLKTVEELTLYAIEQEKRIKDLESRRNQYESLSQEIKRIKNDLLNLKN